MTSVEMVPSSAARATLRAQEQARAGRPRSRAEDGHVSGFWEGQACTLNTQLGVRGGQAPSVSSLRGHADSTTLAETIGHDFCTCVHETTTRSSGQKTGIHVNMLGTARPSRGKEASPPSVRAVAFRQGEF